MEEIFLERLKENYQNPKNFGKLKNSNIKEKIENTSCGDLFEIFINLKNKKIEEIKFFGHGCAISTASFSLFCEKIKNMKIEEIKKLNKKTILKLLGIEISSNRLKCALMPLKILENL